MKVYSDFAWQIYLNLIFSCLKINCFEHFELFTLTILKILLPLEYLKKFCRNILNRTKNYLDNRNLAADQNCQAKFRSQCATQNYESLDIYLWNVPALKNCFAYLFQFYNVFWSLFDLVWITSFCYIWTQNLPKYNLWTWTWSTPCISTFIRSWSVWPRGTVYAILGQYSLTTHW